MSVHVSSLVWQYSRATKSNFTVMLALADSSDDTGRSYLSVPTIAKKARISPRQAGDSVHELAAAGEIWISEGTGPNGCNEYVILWARAYAEGADFPEPVYLIGQRPKNGRPRGSRNAGASTGDNVDTGGEGDTGTGDSDDDSIGKPPAICAEGQENPLHSVQNPLQFVQKPPANHSKPPAICAEPPEQTAPKPLENRLGTVEGTVKGAVSAGAPTTPPTSSKPTPATGTYLPQDWQPDAELIAWAKSRYSHLTDEYLAEQTERFGDHFLAKTGADARSRDWRASWRKWIGNSVQWSEQRREQRTANQPVDNRAPFQPTPKPGVPAATAPQGARRTNRPTYDEANANTNRTVEQLLTEGDGF